MRYRATQNKKTGTWTLFDVPVFGEVGSGDPRMGKKRIDREWLKSSIETSRRRIEEDGYEYPLHVGHHVKGKPNATRVAGRFRLTKVAPMQYQGQMADFVFADYEEVPDDVYQEIKGRKLPHRSVELREGAIERREIDSVALLGTPTPHFRLPVHTGERIDEENDNSGGQEPVLVGGPGPAEVWKSGSNFAALFTEEPEPMKGTLHFSAEGWSLRTEKGATVTPKDGVTLSVGDETYEIEGANFEAVQTLVDSVASEKTRADTAEAEVLRLASIESAKAGDDVAGAAQFAALSAKVDKLETVATQRTLVDAAVKSLEDDGYTVGDEAKKGIAKFAARGAEILDDYIVQYKSHAAPEPPETIGAFMAGGPVDSDEVSKIIAKNPAKADEVRAASLQFDALAQAGNFKMKRESFILDTVGVGV